MPYLQVGYENKVRTAARELVGVQAVALSNGRWKQAAGSPSQGLSF